MFFLVCFLFFLYHLFVKTARVFRRLRFYSTCWVCIMFAQVTLERQAPASRRASYAEDVNYFLKIAVDLRIVLYGGAVRDMFSGDIVQDLDLCGTNDQLDAFLSNVAKKGCFISKRFSDQYDNSLSCASRLVALQILRTAESSVVYVDFKLALTAIREMDFDVNALMQRGEALSLNPALFELKDYAGLAHARAFSLVVKNIAAKSCTGRIKAGPHFLYRYFKMLRKGYTVKLELTQLRSYEGLAFEGKCLVCQEDGRDCKEPSVSFQCACESRVHLSCFKDMFGVERSDECVKKHIELFRAFTQVQPFIMQYKLLTRKKSKPAVGLEEGATAALETADTLDYESLVALDSDPLMNKCMLCKKHFNKEAILLELLYLDFSTRLP